MSKPIDELMTEAELELESPAIESIGQPHLTLVQPTPEQAAAKARRDAVFLGIFITLAAVWFALV